MSESPTPGRIVQQQVLLPASPTRLFDSYLDAAAHAAFTGAPVDIAPHPGAPFSAFGGILTGRILALLCPTLIVQSWRSTAFKPHDPDSTLILVFTPAGPHTRVDLIHLNVPDHDFDSVTAGWPKYYWQPWRAWLEKNAV